MRLINYQTKLTYVGDLVLPYLSTYNTNNMRKVDYSQMSSLWGRDFVL